MGGDFAGGSMKTFLALSLFSLIGMTTASSAQSAEAHFAGGCFWCIEAAFQKIPGVEEVISGYSGGHVENPSYEQVTSGDTGHREAVKVLYDPQRVSYRELVETFWRMFDPTDSGGSFGDRGEQYTSAIFYQTEQEREIAEESKRELNESGRFSRTVVTPIEPLKNFYPAESYHQDYAKNHPLRYKSYSYFSGRQSFIKEHWEDTELKMNATSGKPDNDGFTKPSPEELRERLSPMQFKVTQQEGTEPPFDNAYWDTKQEGIYVDIVSGEPLFSSRDKFDSGTGWPSFTRPLEPKNIVTREDRSLFGSRTEVRSRQADSHLGHVFDDGPAPTGKRYCINSAALRFIPKEDLKEEGYGKYLDHFKE